MSAFISHLKGLVRFDFSFAPPSFRASEDIYEAIQRDMERDYQAMANDWNQVGKDLRYAMGQVYREMSEDEKKRLLVILKKAEAQKNVKSSRRGKKKR